MGDVKVDDSGGGENSKAVENSERVIIEKPLETKSKNSDPMNTDNGFFPRVRQYPSSDKGPFLVSIRTIDNRSLKSDKITKMIRQKIKTDVEIKQVNANKLNVLFPVEKINDLSIDDLLITLAREEANSLPKWEAINKEYRVYIPEERVEVMGVISWAVGQNLENLMRG